MHNTSGVGSTIGKTSVGTDLVQSYLDSLLRDVSNDPDEEELSPAYSLPAAQIIESRAIEAPAFVIPRSEDNVAPISTPVSAESVSDDEQLDLADLPLVALELNPGTERVTPDWARQGFAGLLFEVAGLKMAAPLHALGGISLIEDRLQPVVGQADWFMGLLRWNGRNLRVVDTARFVMPERLENNNHHSAYQSVIVLGDSHWALAVDCANESVNLKADEIRWKQFTGVRPWLAGTVLQRLCALLDVDNLMSMLQQHEQHVRESLSPEHKN